MKPKTMILMVVAVACGLGASFMTSRYLKAARAPETTGEPTVPVLVAKTNVPSWTPIKEPKDMFVVEEMQVSKAPKNAISDLDEVKDQRLKTQLMEKTPLTKDHLLSKEQNSLADKLAPGQRAMTIKVNTESVVGGFVLPGTKVDVLWTTRGPQASSRYLMQSVMVLAVDANDARQPEQKNLQSQSVTLALTPEEAARLTLAGSLGDLRLLLKGEGDHTALLTEVVTPEDLNRRPRGLRKDGAEDRDDKEVARSTAPKTLPPLVEDKKDEKKEAAVEKKKAEERAAAKVEEDRAEKARKKLDRPHRTLLIGKTEKVFTYQSKQQRDTEEDATDDDEDETAGKEEKKAPTPKKDEKTKEQGKPVAASSAFGKSSTRTGRIR